MSVFSCLHHSQGIILHTVYCILYTVIYFFYLFFNLFYMFELIIRGKLETQSLSFIVTMADCGKAPKQPGKQCESHGEYVEAQKARKKYEELRAKDGLRFI